MKHLLITRILITCLAFVVALQIALITGGHFQLSGDLAAAQTALELREPKTGDWVFLVLIAPYLASLVGAWFGPKQARAWLMFSIMASLLFVEEGLTHPVEGLLNSMLSMLEGALLVSVWSSAGSSAGDSRQQAATRSSVDLKVTA